MMGIWSMTFFRAGDWWDVDGCWWINGMLTDVDGFMGCWRMLMFKHVDSNREHIDEWGSVPKKIILLFDVQTNCQCSCCCCNGMISAVKNVTFLAHLIWQRRCGWLLVSRDDHPRWPVFLQHHFKSISPTASGLPSGKLRVCYWKRPKMAIHLPIKDCDCP